MKARLEDETELSLSVIYSLGPRFISVLGVLYTLITGTLVASEDVLCG